MENCNPEEVLLLNIPIEGQLVPVYDGENELNCPSQEILLDFSDDGALLENLLKEFDLECVFPYLKRSNVTFRSLQYMKAEDVKEAIPPLGLRMEFREKLFVWNKKQVFIFYLKKQMKLPIVLSFSLELMKIHFRCRQKMSGCKFHSIIFYKCGS